MSVGSTPKTTGKVDAASKTKTTTKKAAKAATPAGSGTAKKRKIVELESDVSQRNDEPIVLHFKQYVISN